MKTIVDKESDPVTLPSYKLSHMSIQTYPEIDTNAFSEVILVRNRQANTDKTSSPSLSKEGTQAPRLMVKLTI